jgi:hypothetical protein
MPIPSGHTGGFVGWHSGYSGSLPWVPRRPAIADSSAAREPEEKVPDTFFPARTVKMPADSLLLASADLAAIGVAYLALWTSTWGPPLFLFVVLFLSPILLVLTVAHGVVDLSRRRTRLQAIVALLLTAPCWLLVCLSYRAFP